MRKNINLSNQYSNIIILKLIIYFNQGGPLSWNCDTDWETAYSDRPILRSKIYPELFSKFAFKECSDVCALHTLSRPQKPNKQGLVLGVALSHNVTRLKMDSDLYIDSHASCGYG